VTQQCVDASGNHFQIKGGDFNYKIYRKMPLKKNVTQQCVDASGNNTHASFPTQ
jgi:hypothetical protein